MRDKRTRGPGSQGPNDSRSKTDWLDERLQPWAATPPANDNALVRKRQSPAPANDFADEATTLYQRERSWPHSSANKQSKPARRPSARYRPQAELQQQRSQAQLPKDEPRFGIEGSLPRSLRPGEVDRGRNYGVVLAGLLVIGLGTMWTLRGGAWSRAMVSLSAYSSSVASTRATLGQGHVVEPHHDARLHVAPLPAAPMQAELQDVAAADVMEFELADVPADASAHTRAEHIKHQRELRAQRAAKHANTSKSAALAKPIQPLLDKAEDWQEPVFNRAAVNEGTLQVNSRPWSRVLVDGHFMGHTPQRALRLPVGLHRVLLVNDELDMSKLFEVNIPAGEVITRVELLDESAHTSR